MNRSSCYQYSSLLAFCLLTVGLLFIKCFSHDWTYDDTPVILNNQDIRSLANFFNDQYSGRPLRELSYWLDYQVWGLQPGGFMVQNLFWHGLCAGLLGCLLLRLGMLWRWALLGSLLFLSHPLTVEVAANNGHRKDSLCLAFILLAVLCHLQACRRERARWLWLGAAVAAFVVACLAKQHALLTPLIWVAVELSVVPLQRRILARRVDWLQSLAAIGVVAGVAGGFVWFLLSDGWQRLQSGSSVMLLKFNHLDIPDLAAYYRMVTKALPFAVGKIFWPLELAPEYTFKVPDSLFDPWILAALLLVGAYLYGGFWLWRYRRSWWFCWVWVGAFWLPVLNFLPWAYPVADRYLYTPLVGMILLLMLASAELAGRWRLLIPALLLSVLTINISLTWRQVDVWQSELSLWTHVSQVNPLSTTAFINLSSQAINIVGDFELGRQHAEHAIALNPRHPLAHVNHAVALERMGQDDEAVRAYLRAYELYVDKTHPMARDIRMTLARNHKVFLR